MCFHLKCQLLCLFLSMYTVLASKNINNKVAIYWLLYYYASYSCCWLFNNE